MHGDNCWCFYRTAIGAHLKFTRYSRYKFYSLQTITPNEYFAYSQLLENDSSSWELEYILAVAYEVQKLLVANCWLQNIVSS